jgi:hypothetical protein
MQAAVVVETILLHPAQHALAELEVQEVAATAEPGATVRVFK